jgi:hypothetical protein
MIYWRLTGDDRAASAASRIEFLAPHLHPDLTAAAEAVSAAMPMSGRSDFCCTAVTLWRRRSSGAWRRSLTAPSGFALISTTTSASARWGILPVLAALLARPSDLAETSSEFARCHTPGWTVHWNAGLAAYHRDDLHLYAPFAGGAVTRIYRGERLILEDLGLHIRDGDKAFAVRDYDSDRPLRVTGNGISTSISFGETQCLPACNGRVAAGR